MGNRSLEVEFFNLCQRARKLGDTIDITGCRYGLHTRTKTDIGETEYYRFLAGFTSLTGARQVLEIGTHYGGSIMAMARGAGPYAKLVTVDITRRNEPAFAAYPNIRRVQGDSTKQTTATLVRSYFSPPIDLIYIDSLHTKEAVLLNLELYASLKPRYAVFDDIHISPSMDELWAELSAKYPACDLSDIADRKRVGFGAIQMRP